MTKMTDVYHLTLLPDSDEQAFEEFAKEKGFALASVTRAGTITNQFLLKEQDEEGGQRHYLWLIQWNLHFGMETLDEIGESLWKARQQITSQAEISSFSRYVQKAESIVSDRDIANP